MRENWERFIEITKAKSISHTKVAQYWDVIHKATNIVIIILGATTTFLSLIKSVPPFVISAIAAVSTLTSAIMAFMRPHDRRQIQYDSAKIFKVLMLRMVRCESDEDYEKMWLELNKAVMDEPFLPNKFKTENENESIDWKLTHELQMLIAEKDHELKEVLVESRVGSPCLRENRQARKPPSHLTPFQAKRAEQSRKSPRIRVTRASATIGSPRTRAQSPRTRGKGKKTPRGNRNKYDLVMTQFSNASSSSSINNNNNNNNIPDGATIADSNIIDYVFDENSDNKDDDSDEFKW